MSTTSDFTTEEQYLISEPEAEYKSEYRHGRVVAMTGGTRTHALLAANVLGGLHSQLRGRPCAAYGSDMRFKVAAARFYTYPDVSVVCGKPLADARDACTFTNPVLIVEVLSPGTEAYDRGEKFAYYKQLDSLREYVLVAEDRVLVERFTRGDGGEWTGVKLDSLKDVLTLTSIGCTLALRDVYEKTDFLA